MLQPFHQPGVLEAGCDEAGRGCLAGPVVAAAVIWPPDLHPPHLTDSKKLSANLREELALLIKREAVSWAIAEAGPEEIDQLNILNASFLAMHRAIGRLDPRPEALLIDGNRFTPFPGLPHHCMVKGDGRFLSIAAASILAKTYRDARMQALHRQYPHFGWQNNMGYPTLQHRSALQRHGPSPVHRRSFRLLPEGRQGSLFGPGDRQAG